MASRSPHRWVSCLGLVVAACAATAEHELPAGARNVEPLSAANRAQLLADLAAARNRTADPWLHLPPRRRDRVVVVVEIQSGGQEKLEYDTKLGCFALDRVIPAGVGGYPANYGFIPGTFYHDGDPIDVLVLGAPLPTGSVVAAQLVAVMDTVDQKGMDAKLVARHGARARELTASEKEAITRFFGHYKDDDGDPSTFSRVQGWRDASAAEKELDAAAHYFSQMAGEPRSTGELPTRLSVPRCPTRPR